MHIYSYLSLDNVVRIENIYRGFITPMAFLLISMHWIVGSRSSAATKLVYFLCWSHSLVVFATAPGLSSRQLPEHGRPG